MTRRAVITLTIPVTVDATDPTDARHHIEWLAGDLARIVESSAWAASIGLVTATTTHDQEESE